MHLSSFDAAFDALPVEIRKSRIDCAMILGSGWSQTLEQWATVEQVDYGQLPGLGSAHVAGHAGQLVLADRAGRRILAFCGRRHWYEGEGWQPIATPVELSRRLGIGTLLITNAAGGIRPTLSPGDLMIVHDHINTAGVSPLQGSHIEAWGPRFPDQSAVYPAALRSVLHSAAHAAGLRLAEGTYAFTAGPTYETPAEVRSLAAQGADAVGMSTVPEAILANAMGIRVAAVSCITNMAAGISGPHLSHSEVLEQSQATAPQMMALLEAFLTALDVDQAG